MSLDFLREGVMWLIPLILSLSFHEFAHAWSAFKLGDDTAARAGRLSLNPLVHIDPIGTILLPLIGVPFGWAKPVPVSPQRFDRKVSMRGGMMITAVAGPVSNLLLAVVCAVCFQLLARFAPGLLHGYSGGVRVLLIVMVQINVALAVFNMIPVYPLDGSRIADYFISERYRAQWESINRVAPFLLMGMLVFGFGRSVISVPTAFLTKTLFSLAALVVP